MYPDDRVLVGVINRKRDLLIARDQHWYRIPQKAMPRGVYAEYLAFFLSGYAAKGLYGGQSGIHLYAQRRGIELLYRRDLLPDEPHHKHADQAYYKVQLGDLVDKQPPITNDRRQTISFIYTTWDRFVRAKTISDLYSDADYFVDRIFHALRDARYRPERVWAAEGGADGPPQLRIICQSGFVVASTQPIQDAIWLDASQTDDALLAKIIAAIASKGGPAYINIPAGE